MLHVVVHPFQIHSSFPKQYATLVTLNVNEPKVEKPGVSAGL